MNAGLGHPEEKQKISTAKYLLKSVPIATDHDHHLSYSAQDEIVRHFKSTSAKQKSSDLTSNVIVSL